MSAESNPYPGPRPLETGDSIFGRTREKFELYYLLNSNRVVLLVSPSGAGKTSLLQAGLVPFLRERDFYVPSPIRVAAPFSEKLPKEANRFTLSVMESLEPEDSPRKHAELASLSLKDYFSKHVAGSAGQLNHVLIFDQFEEVLTQDPQDIPAKKRFFSELGDLLHNSRIWAVFAIREEYLAALDPYSANVPTQFMHRFWLELLTPKNAIFAIKGPARERKVHFAAGVARGLVDTLSLGGSFVEPVQLQAVCHRLWAERGTSNTISLPESGPAGIVEGALREYYNESLRRACRGSLADQRRVREWIGERLISSTGVRVLVPARGVDAAITPLLDELKLTFFLIREELRPRGAAWLELAHDTLIKPVLASNEDWFNTNLTRPQNCARLWDRNGRADNLLSIAHAFWLGASREYESAYVGACRRKAVLISVLALVVVALGYQSWNSYRNEVEVSRQKALNRSRELAASAEGEIFSRDTTLPVWLALRALDSAATTEAEEALHHAMQKLGGPKMETETDQLKTVAFSRTGSWAATGGTDKQVILWQPVDGGFNKKRTLTHGGSVYSVAFSASGKHIAAGGVSGVWVWEVGGSGASPPKKLEPAGPVNFVAYSSDGESEGKWLAAGFQDGKVRLWSFPDYTLVKELSFPDNANGARQVAFSPAGDRIAAVFQDGKGTAKIWKVESGEEVFTSSSAGPNDALVAVAFHPQNAEIAIGHRNGKVEVWNTKLKIPRYSFSVPGKLTSLAYSFDGETIFTAGVASQGRSWRNGNLHLILDRGDQNQELSAVVPHPDGQRVAFVQPDVTEKGDKITGRGGGVRFYDLDLKRLKQAAEKDLTTWTDCAAQTRKYDPAYTCPPPPKK